MISKEDIEAFELPEWAERKAQGEYKAIRCALPTRDGRRIGNAVNAGTYRNASATFPTIYIVITDAGNIIHASENEMKELFYPPEWVMKDLLPAHTQALKEETMT